MEEGKQSLLDNQIKLNERTVNQKHTSWLDDNIEFYHQQKQKVFKTESYYKLSFDLPNNVFQIEDQFFTSQNIKVQTQYTVKCAYLVESTNIKQYRHKLVLLSFKLEQAKCCKTRNRYLKQHVFFHDQFEKLELWKNLIHYISIEDNYLTNNQELIKQKKIQPFLKTLLVFINPAGGSGKAQKVWGKAKTLLNYCGFQYNEILTQRRYHAKDYIENMCPEEIKLYSGIICCSGDGIIHEVVNGIQNSPYKKLISEIPIGGFPGGSSSALFKNTNEYSNQPYTLECCVYLIAKGISQKMDLIELEINTQQNKIYSFLSINYAFIADLDLNSEFMRCFGEFRYDIYGLYRVLLQKTYPATIIYSEDSTNLPKINEEFENYNNFNKIQKDLKYLVWSNCPFIGSTAKNAPLSEINDGSIDMELMGNEGWFQLVKMALKFQDGSHFNIQQQKVVDNLKLLYSKVKSFRIITEQSNKSKGLFSIDGEKYECNVMQGKIIPKTLKVFCLNKQIF